MDDLKQETERLLQIAESPVHGNYTLQRFAEHIRKLQAQVDAAQDLAYFARVVVRGEGESFRGIHKLGKAVLAKWEARSK